MRRLLAAVLLSLALPAVAAAQGEGVTAPSYPGNTVKVEPPGEVVGGRVMTVKLSGTSVWSDNPTSNTTTPYTLSLYVQNPEVDPQCGDSYSVQLQKSININDNASSSISGFVLQDALNVYPNAPSNQRTWELTTPPFAVRAGIKKALLCAYVRYITDDVAAYALPITVKPGTCSFTRTVARRSSRLPLGCNISGTVKVKLKRGKLTKTKTVSISPKNGKGTLSLTGVAKGSYAASFSISNLPMGTQHLRVT